MARQDPVDRAADDGTDLYEVSDWEPRSAADRIAVGIHSFFVTGSKVFLVLLGLVILLSVFGLTGLSLIADPFVTALVALSVLPALVIAVYIWYADVTTGEPLSLLVITFVLAVLFAGFAAILNAVGMVVISPVQLLGSELLVLAAFFFLIVGPIEEGVKLLAVRLYAFNHDRFDAVIDGAVYGAVAGLGFATIENAIYITGALEEVGGLAAENALQTAGSITASRTLAGPGHVLYSAIAGYYLGLAKFNRDRAGPIVIKGLLVAALFHAVYNLTVGAVGPALARALGVSTLVGLLLYIVGYQSIVGFYLYRKLSRYRSAFQDHDAGRFPMDPDPQTTEFEPDGGSAGIGHLDRDDDDAASADESDRRTGARSADAADPDPEESSDPFEWGASDSERDRR